jgi:hypothetical protein
MQKQKIMQNKNYSLSMFHKNIQLKNIHFMQNIYKHPLMLHRLH